MPYDSYLGPDISTMALFRKLLSDNSSGLDLPAAVIVECIQAEGGVNIASPEWLRELALVCYDYDILLIIDDIQVGNGRTGDFSVFEVRHQAGHGDLVQSHRCGATPGVIALPVRSGSVEAGRAHRHLPGQQPGVCGLL
ncbi:MAG: aminotransferase class III-fold pyridoxal phosphate-dependent enzyme [Desulfobacterales bacterium]